MGHCGRSSYGSLYSLREVKRINNNFTLNKSHLTAAIDDEDGTLYQLKGPKNSKPSSKYHDYILPLFYKKVDDGEYYIEGLGSEYESRLDFKLTDLPNSVIIELYEKRPELFKGRSLQKKLMNLGLIEKKDINYILYLTISAKDIEDYVEGNSVTGRGTKPNGEKYKRTLFEDILSSSLDFDDCDEDLECIFNYCIKNEIIEKPNFYIDSRWSPSGEEESFNEHLEYRLSEINS
jgi:hypothetical protein